MMQKDYFLLIQHIIRPLHNLLVLEIPSDIDSKDKLLSFLADELRFPDYFGHNWDALNDIFYGYLNEDYIYFIIDNSNLNGEAKSVFREICEDSFKNNRYPRIIYVEKFPIIYDASISN